MQRFRVITATLGLAVLLGASGCITMPGSAGAKVHEVTFTAMETEIVVDGNGTKYKAWTFNGQMPGPVVRVTEGDTVNFTLIGDKNNSFPHSMDFHAAELDFLKNYHKTVSAGETQVLLRRKEARCILLSLRCQPHDPARGPWHVRCHHCGPEGCQCLAKGRSGIRPGPIRVLEEPGQRAGNV